MTDEKLVLTVDHSEIDALSWDQIGKALSITCLEKLAIMPDVHGGYGLCIGGVALLDGYIWPSAIGYDIGCGMVHVNTEMTPQELGIDSKDGKNSLYDSIVNAIPVGFNQRKETLPYTEFKSGDGNKELENFINTKMGFQLGTLGGGNHFIEIGINSDNKIGITIHSGSRKAGHSIADYWMGKANKIGTNFNGFGMFHLESEDGKAYLNDMNWAHGYALTNREKMVKTVLEVMNLNPEEFNIYNENHNTVEMVTSSKIIHRKGATPAHKGQVGVIPANQGQGVYVTEGLGNEEFLWSASHGAGRKMSRKKAKENLSKKDFKSQMKGVVARTDKKVLDEAPDAYKDITKVLEAQDGKLIDVKDHFSPLIVVKG